MILLATNKRDITTDLVVLELKRRDVRFLRMNTEDVANQTILLPDGDPATGIVRVDGIDWRIGDFHAAYFRRPLAPEPSRDLDVAAADYVVAEWSAVLRTVWNALEGRWLNSPFAMQRAEDKPRQLTAARKAGLRVPDTLVTNDFAAASAFLAEGGVVKPLRQSLVESGESPGKVVFTSRIASLDRTTEEAFRLAPVILQREIPKRSDVRVTVVDGMTYAASIDSQAHPDTMVDWRRGARLDLAHRRFDLPARTAAQCVEVVAGLGLRFAAVDLVEDVDGALWFLEANPNGQWAWIERRTGLPITTAIVEALTCR